MRLLNVQTLELEQFLGNNTPPYAILSHTWGVEEVTFHDLSSSKYQHLQGFKKIQGCCKICRQEGYRYVWIDTCCIDKSSSAELSEAINSMFKWYKQSAVCYAHLSDVHSLPMHSDMVFTEFVQSLWFTRGWTLQELLAPDSVIFFNSSWQILGTKTNRSLMRSITSATNIDAELFIPRSPNHGDHDLVDVTQQLRRYSIAQKLSWAAKRKTSRVEDQAYCLLGIFEVNMPLLYGEGDRAFLRLQQVIMQESNDTSIFAWEYPMSFPTRSTSGLLAYSPAFFEERSDVRYLEYSDVKPDAQTAPTVVYETSKNTVRLRVSSIGDFEGLRSKILRNRFVCSIICRRNRQELENTWEPREVSFVDLFSKDLPLALRKEISIIFLDCQDSFGRIGFLVQDDGRGLLQRCHFCSLIYFPEVEEATKIPAATFRYFRLYQHDAEPDVSTNTHPLIIKSFLGHLGYDMLHSEELQQEDVNHGNTWFSQNEKQSNEYLLFRNTRPLDWPSILVAYRKLRFPLRMYYLVSDFFLYDCV